MPTLLFTALVLICPAGSVYEVEMNVPGVWESNLHFNVPFFYVCIVGLYYMILEPIAGVRYFTVIINH